MLQELKDARVDFDSEIGLNVIDISLQFNDTLLIPLEEGDEGIKPKIKLMPGENDLLELHISQVFPPMTLDSFKIFDDSNFSKVVDIPFFSDFYSEGNLKFGFNLNTFNDRNKFNGLTLDSLKLDKGNLSIDLNTYTHFFSSFSFRFPGITNPNNKILEVENFVPTLQNHKLNIDLSDYKIKLLRKNFTEYFLVELDYYLESKNNSDTTVTPKIDFNMGGLDIDYFYGSLGIDTIVTKADTIELFKEKFLNGQDFEVDVYEPSIKLNVRNQFGLPFEIGIDKATMIFQDLSEADVTGLPKSVIINAPLLAEKNEIITTNIEINPNTNLDLLISKSPKEIHLGYQVLSNPYDEFQKNYLRDSDTLFAELNMRIPFELSISEIKLDKKTDLAFFSSLETAKVKPVFIQVISNISNSFPFELNVQSYFLDKDSVVLDSLFSAEVEILGSTSVNSPNYITIESAKEKTQIENLYDCTQMITVAKFQTTNSEEKIPVKIFGESELKMELTFLSKLNVNNGK